MSDEKLNDLIGEIAFQLMRIEQDLSLGAELRACDHRRQGCAIRHSASDREGLDE